MKQSFKEGNAIIGKEINFTITELQRLATARDIVDLCITPECYIESKWGKLTDAEYEGKRNEINRNWINKTYSNKIAYLRTHKVCANFLELYYSEVEFITKFLSKITYNVNGASSVDRELTEL